MIRFTVELKREKKLLFKLHKTSTLGIINLVISRRINFFPFSCSRDPKTFNDTLVTITHCSLQSRLPLIFFTGSTWSVYQIAALDSHFRSLWASPVQFSRSMNKKLTISEIYVVLISLTCESENKNKPEHLLVQTVREKKYPNGPELPSFGRKNIFLNNLFYN